MAFRLTKKRVMLSILALVVAWPVLFYFGYPITYKRFMWRAYQVEAKSTLIQLCHLQKNYRAAKGHYLGPIGKDPLYLTSQESLDFKIGDRCLLENELGLKRHTECAKMRYAIAITSADASHFRAIAEEAPGLPEDRRPAPFCNLPGHDSWEINEDCKARVIYDSVADCTGFLHMLLTMPENF